MKIIRTADINRSTHYDANTASWVYNGLDCCVTLEVLENLLPQLDEQTQKVYDLSRALQAPVLEMTTRGLLVDIARRNTVVESLRAKIKLLERNLDTIIKEGIGLEINWRSPMQLRWLLYDIMQLPVVRKRNAAGRFAPTVNREALEKLSNYFIAQPICNHLLAMRDLGKKIGFLETSIDKDNHIRCNLNIAGTNTGRLASAMSDFGTGTNLQNVDRDLRSAFIAEKGMKYANIDLEQADSRNVGALCWNIFYHSHGPEFAGAYLDACESGDLHTTVCRMAWSNLAWGDKANWRSVADQIAYRNLSYRDLAKRLGHGTNYYGTPPTMAQHSKVRTSLIEEFQLAYFNAFPCIKHWHRWVDQELKETRMLSNLFGRRRRFFGRPGDVKMLREAIAYGGQSSTADEINEGLLRLWRANIAQLLIQVHDSVLIQYPEELESQIVPMACKLLTIEYTLEGGREFSVPVEAKVGWNWGDVAKDNPDGLVKWKGKDERTRKGSTVPKKFSLWNM